MASIIFEHKESKIIYRIVSVLFRVRLEALKAPHLKVFLNFDLVLGRYQNDIGLSFYIRRYTKQLLEQTTL